MGDTHTPEEVQRIARQFEAAETKEVLNHFIRRQKAKILACRRLDGYDDPKTAYAASVGHRAAMQLAQEMLDKVDRAYGVQRLQDDIISVMEKDFSDL